MSVATNVEAGSFAGTAPGARRAARSGVPLGVVRPAAPRPGRLVRRVSRAGSRPAGLAAARHRAVPASCAVRPGEHPLAWLALVGGLVLLIVVAFGLIGGASDGSSSAPVPQRTTLVRVTQGQTLWEIAQRMDPGSGTSAVVDRIRQLNGLTDGTLYPGELLQVPVAR